jgi:hypothetical protein
MALESMGFRLPFRQSLYFFFFFFLGEITHVYCTVARYATPFTSVSR